MKNRAPVVVEDDEDGFQSTWKAPEKRAEVSRNELLGAKGGRVPKAKAAREAMRAKELEEQQQTGVSYGRVTENSYGYDPDSEDAYARSSQQELEQLAVTKSKEVTSSLKNALKITEDTKGIGSETLVTLHKQGEQLAKTHDTAVVLEQELVKGEKLLSKLGGMFSYWRPKKGKKITGPSYRPGIMPTGLGTDSNARREMFEGKTNKDDDEDEYDNGYESVVKQETREQDLVLDHISKNLDDLKLQAEEMGAEMKRQDKALDELTDDIVELNKRNAQAIRKANRIIGRR